MKWYLSVTFLALVFSAFAQNDDLLQDAITKPTLSLRCKELFNDRDDKIRIQQRLNGLLQRNASLIRKTPTNKETLLARMQASQVRVKNELYLATLQISSMEENIVRSGCPGLSL